MAAVALVLFCGGGGGDGQGGGGGGRGKKVSLADGIQMVMERHVEKNIDVLMR